MNTAKARKAMVDSQVRPNDVPDLALQAAMEALPREKFVPANLSSQAYVEMDVPLFEGRWLLKARDFSKLVHALRLQPTDLVLDIGCGYGYSTAVLANMAGMVIGLEDQAAAVEKSSDLLSGLELDNVAVIEGALAEGAASQGPFDAILIAAGVDEIPQRLKDQLKPDGGRLATIKVKDGLGYATIIQRTGDAFGERVVFEASPAGIPSGFAKAPEFQF